MKGKIDSGFFFDKIPYVKHEPENSNKSIVLLPGSISLLYWPSDPIENATNNRFLIPEQYTLYLLGYDKNLPPNYTIDQMVEDYAKVIKDNIGPTSILAISYGGNIAIPLAAKYPELIEKLLLVTSAHSSTITGYAKKFIDDTIQYAEKENFEAIIELTFDLFNKGIFKKPMRTFLQKQGIYENHYSLSTIKNALEYLRDANLDLKHYLSNIQAPTLVLGGTKDKLISEEIYHETAELIPKGKLSLFKAGHLVTVEKALKVKAAIFEFLLDGN